MISHVLQLVPGPSLERLILNENAQAYELGSDYAYAEETF